MLQSEVALVVVVDVKLVAFGANGETFDYGDERCQAESGNCHDAQASLSIADDDE